MAPAPVVTKMLIWAVAYGSVWLMGFILVISLINWTHEWWTLRKLEAITTEAKVQGEPAKQALISLLNNQPSDRRVQLFGLTCIIESSLKEEEGREWGDVGACHVSLLALQHFTHDHSVQVAYQLFHFSLLLYETKMGCSFMGCMRFLG
jgi:hypothetical protein